MKLVQQQQETATKHYLKVFLRKCMREWRKAVERQMEEKIRIADAHYEEGLIYHYWSLWIKVSFSLFLSLSLSLYPKLI